MAEYDILYLQQQEHIAGLPIVQPWRVNDDDAEYILSTSRRVAADALYEALDRLLIACNIADAQGDLSQYVGGIYLDSAHAALALADGDKEVE